MNKILTINHNLTQIIGSYLLPDEEILINLDKKNLYKIKQLTVYLWYKLNSDFYISNDNKKINNLKDTKIFHNKQNTKTLICDYWDVIHK